MSAGYTWEKFHGAVIGLVASRDPLPDRIAKAYIYHLMHAEHDGLPTEIREDFARLSKAMQGTTAKGDEGDAMASARTLGELEAGELLDLIVSMYDRVAKYGPNGR
jgi:hypothetical protein